VDVSLTGALVILTTVISSIGLVVGRHRLMNIMLISVHRAHARKLVYAKLSALAARHTFGKFPAESLVLTLVAATIGILNRGWHIPCWFAHWCLQFPHRFPICGYRLVSRNLGRRGLVFFGY